MASPWKASDWSYSTIMRARAMMLPLRVLLISGKAAMSGSTMPVIS
jgi:hypothetical protein